MPSNAEISVIEFVERNRSVSLVKPESGDMSVMWFRTIFRSVRLVKSESGEMSDYVVLGKVQDCQVS